MTAVLNPGFSTDPEWYRRYGMVLTARHPGRECGRGHLTARVGQEVLGVDLFCWSAEAHEQALRAAGFDRASHLHGVLAGGGFHHEGLAPEMYQSDAGAVGPPLERSAGRPVACPARHAS